VWQWLFTWAAVSVSLTRVDVVSRYTLRVCIAWCVNRHLAE